MHLALGHILNKSCYQIKKVIGQGGFGITYLADEIGYFRSTGFGDSEYVKSRNPEQVVIKELFYGEYCKRDAKTGLISVINPEKKLEFEKLVQNQLDEGIKLRALNHPNIVRTRDIFKENETAYMVMDFVDGTDLEDLLERESRLPLEQTLKYITQVLSALAHIHERNQVHLDIKPSNILIRKQTDEAILIDFGASQSYDQTGKIEGRTSQLVVAMTRHYAPNEQGDIDNLKQFDATFDTYAAGATLYHMLTGEKPPLSSMLSTGREKLKLVTSFPGNEKITDFMDSIVSKALAPMYNDRFKSAKEFELLLRKYPKYPLLLNEIKTKITSGTPLGEVLKYVEEAEKQFLPTETLNKLKKAIAEKQERELSNRNVELNLQNANYYFEHKNYEEALKFFLQVAQIQPENEDVAQKIKICNEQIAESKGAGNLEALFQQAKKDVSEGNLFSARYKLEQIIQEDSSHAEAAKLLEKVLSDIESEDEGTILLDTSKPKETDAPTVLVNIPKSSSKSKGKKKGTGEEKSASFKQFLDQNKWIKFAVPALFVLIIAVVLIANFAGNKKAETATELGDSLVLAQDTTVLKEIEPEKTQEVQKPSPTAEQTRKPEVTQTVKSETEAAATQSPKKTEVVKEKTQTEKGRISYGGHSYSGELQNGKPHGSGTLTFSFGDQVDDNDPKANMAEKGDYLKGRWNNGKLEFGTLYNSSGEKKVTIVIGRF